MQVAHRPFDPEPGAPTKISPALRHPLFAWLGLRPLASQHTEAEDALLRKYARLARQTLVEIGVAEGGSAISTREAMSTDASLYLIDPYVPGRIPWLSITYLTARRWVGSVARGSVHWLRQFSFDAVREWPEARQIDLLFIDGDHSEAGCRRDWQEWHGLVRPGGYVIFHDARIFTGGWTHAQVGSVRVVESLFYGDKALPDWQIVDGADSMLVVRKQA